MSNTKQISIFDPKPPTLKSLPNSTYLKSRTPYPSDSLNTRTVRDQLGVERNASELYSSFSMSLQLPSLFRQSHLSWLFSALRSLPSSYCALDASRPWICYWIYHSLELLGNSHSSERNTPEEPSPRSHFPDYDTSYFYQTDSTLDQDTIDFLSRCQSPTGGFGGGPGQLPHLAPSYASINCLASIGSQSAFDSIKRKEMYQWMLKLKQPDGSFSMHEDGESDVRATYCALSIAKMLNLLTEDLVKGTSDFILSCQSFEGGIAQNPGTEAHGGFTFCGVAAMEILGDVERFNINTLINWLVEKQLSVEGGFNGRVNKLVDSCYSFWQGAVFPILDQYLLKREEYPYHSVYQYLRENWGKEKRNQNELNKSEGDVSDDETKPKSNKSINEIKDSEENRDDDDNDWEDIDENDPNLPQEKIQRKLERKKEREMERQRGRWLFDQFALQEWILICCQSLEGGFRDKPTRGRDYYHTCYALSGLSVAQNNIPLSHNSSTPNEHIELTVVGAGSNLLREIHPIHNVEKQKCFSFIRHFSKLSKSFD